MKKFTHILPMNSKKQADEAVLSACINKMKDISDVKEHDLKSTYADFIRHMTLTQASDVVMNHMKKLPIFEKYTLAKLYKNKLPNAQLHLFEQEGHISTLYNHIGTILNQLTKKQCP